MASDDDIDHGVMQMRQPAPPRFPVAPMPRGAGALPPVEVVIPPQWGVPEGSKMDGNPNERLPRLQGKGPRR